MQVSNFSQVTLDGGVFACLSEICYILNKWWLNELTLGFGRCKSLEIFFRLNYRFVVWRQQKRD